MSSEEAVGIVVPIVAALLGLLPWFLERRRRMKIEDDNRKLIWSDISRVRGLMVDLEKDEEKDESKVVGGPGALQAVGMPTVMFRDLLCDAFSTEHEVDLDTVEKMVNLRQTGLRLAGTPSTDAAALRGNPRQRD